METSTLERSLLTSGPVRDLADGGGRTGSLCRHYAFLGVPWTASGSFPAVAVVDLLVGSVTVYGFDGASFSSSVMVLSGVDTPENIV